MLINFVDKVFKDELRTSSWPLLIIAIAIMLLLVAYPPVVIGTQGRVQYVPLLLILWSMSAGFVRGIGFIPHQVLLRLLLSKMACYFTLATFIEIVLIHRLTNY